MIDNDEKIELINLKIKQLKENISNISLSKEAMLEEDDAYLEKKAGYESLMIDYSRIISLLEDQVQDLLSSNYVL